MEGATVTGSSNYKEDTGDEQGAESMVFSLDFSQEHQGLDLMQRF